MDCSVRPSGVARAADPGDTPTADRTGPRPAHSNPKPRLPIDEAVRPAAKPSTADRTGPRPARRELTDASAPQLELPETRTTPNAAERTFLDSARDADMPTGAKLIYVLLATYARLLARVDIGICYPRRDRLKRQAGRMSWNTFEKWLSWLYAEHWVAARTDGRGRMTFYVYSPAGRMRVWATPEIGVAATPEIGVAQARPHLPGKGSGKRRTVAAAAGTQGTPRASAADRRRRQQQQRREEDRIEGLFAAIAPRAREAGHLYDEADERQRLARGEITVEDLQRQADELLEEVREHRLRRAHRL